MELVGSQTLWKLEISNEAEFQGKEQMIWREMHVSHATSQAVGLGSMSGLLGEMANFEIRRIRK